MGVLVKKLLRTIWHTRGQFFAVVTVVTLGIVVFISMSTAYYNLERSKEVFYRENHFADYFFHVIKAPQSVLRQVSQVSGVTHATGRIQKDLPIFKEDGQRGTARLTGYPLPMEHEVNRFQLNSGRLFEKNPGSGIAEVLVDPSFFQANQLKMNSTIEVVAEKKKISLQVVGTAISPEFIYPIKDAASFMPEPLTFALVMIPLEEAQEILMMSGEINQVLITLAPGANETRVKEQVEKILKPYGNLASYPRRNQLSHAVLQGELDGLKVMARFLPITFLLIAALIQFILLGRMIKSQRLQIGVMKALGYSNTRIMVHYTGYSLAVGLLGAFLGTIFGMMLATVFSNVYAMYFNLPGTIGGINITVIISGCIFSIIVAVIAGISASRSVVAIKPAESMRSEPPKITGNLWLERWKWLWQRLNPSWKMSLRSMGRNRFRFLVVLIGIVFGTGMLVVSLFFNDSLDFMLTRHYEHDQLYDYLIRFQTPVKENDLSGIARLDGVIKTEPVLEVPVRVYSQKGKEEDLLTGLPPEVTLKRLADTKGERLRIPEDGVLLSEITARKLNIKEGDLIEVETLFSLGPSCQESLLVAGINHQMIGNGSFLDLSRLNRILQEGHLVTGAMLKVDPGKFAQVEALLDQMTNISAVSSRQKELDNFKSYLGSMIYTTGIMILFAVVLGFAIVYNASVISFGERRREFASLRVLGFTRNEVSSLIWKEYLVQAFVGTILGLPFGYLLARSLIKAVSTDIYTMPVVIYPMTYFLSALGGILFVSAALCFVIKGVKNLDLVEVLKNRD